MLCTSTRPLINSPLTHFTTRPLTRFTARRLSLSSTTTTPTIKMSTTTIEHIVLFKVKPTADPTQLSTMLSSLSSLKSLPMVLHLTTGQLLENRSQSLSFTHLLHSRYLTKEDLSTYSSHPDHLSAVRSSVLPICDDIMAVDWVSEVNGEVDIPPGSAMRVQLVKLKEGVDKKEEVIGAVKEIKCKVKGVKEISIGENFSPARAKGFEICSIGVFDGVEELKGLEGNVEVESLKDKVREFIDDLVVVDYVVPGQSSSL